MLTRILNTTFTTTTGKRFNNIKRRLSINWEAFFFGQKDRFVQEQGTKTASS